MIAFHRSGLDGSPVVVFLHGAGLTRRLWDPQVAHLSPRYDCIAVDLRGHGESRGPGGEVYLAEDHAADVIEMLDTLDVPRAHVIGLSLGGMVGQELALSHPARVASLVTIGAPNDARPNVFAGLAMDAVTRHVLRKVASGGMEWAARVAMKRWSTHPDVQRYMFDDSHGQDPTEFARVWRGVGVYRVRDRLGSMVPPVLAVVGSTDINLRQVRLGAKLMPNCRLEVVGGAGHVTNRDAPDAVNALIAEWLDGQCP